VNVHYHGTLPNGIVFDSSKQRGQPISFPLNGVIKGWTEGLQLMKVRTFSKEINILKLIIIYTYIAALCSGNAALLHNGLL
jgi:FKBP-type peptidyl-prolyl cis-trans isomerase